MTTKKRTVLAILSNRFIPGKPARYIELRCKPDGSILEEKLLKRVPRKAIYDEVWENDDGRTELSSCTRMKHSGKHPLEKRPIRNP